MASVFFDSDGVVIRSRGSDGTFLWQSDLQAKLGIGPSVTAALFEQPRWNEILCGRRRFRDHLRAVFAAAGVTCSPDEFIEFWLANDLTWHTGVLELAERLTAAGHRLFIATNQDALRSAHIRTQPAVARLFDGVFASADLGACKPSVEFHTAVRRRLPLSSDAECVVIDDGQQNVDAAATAGWRGILFDPDRVPSHTPEYLRSELRSLL
jgi:putative hydrolase of the HAD superfamily